MFKKKLQWKLYISSFFFLFAFFMGYYFSQNSWDKKIFVHLGQYSSNNRNLASVKKTNLVSTTLLNSKKNKIKIVSTSVIKYQNQKIQFYLGNILVSSSPQPLFICQKYNVVNMLFKASGMSFNGESPKMILQTNCIFKPNNLKHIGPFIIPNKIILNSSIDTTLFNIKDTLYYFSNVILFWPKTWVLQKIRFFNNDFDSKDLVFTFSSKNPKDYFTFNLK